MRGAWLDADDPVGRHSRRHDGAPGHRRDDADDPEWIPPSQRGKPGQYRKDVPANRQRPTTVPGRRLRGAWLDDSMHGPSSNRHRRGPSDVVGPDSPQSTSKSSKSSKGAPSEDLSRPQPAPGWTGAITVIGGLFALGMVVAGAVGSSDTRSAAIIMVLLGLIFFPILKKLAGGRRDYQQILTAGLMFKVTMTIARYYLASGGYYKNSDAYGYDFYGRQVADQYLKHGQLPPWNTFTGTSFLRLVTGFVYTVMPASELAAFFVFAAFSFTGTLLFWKAVQKFAPPPGDRFYLLLLMFIPSFVYWPSALGKEAFIILCLGLTTYGFACVLQNDLVRGIPCIAGGVAGMTMVRPHVGVAVMIGLTIATVLAKQSGRRTGLFAMTVLLLVGSAFVISRANAFFKSDITSASNITTQLDAAGKRTGQGGSEFTPTPVNPVNFPFAVVTVLIRPFPWESTSVPELATALESMVIAYLIIKNFKQIRGRVRRDNPIAIYALVVTLVFVVLFWQFSNFGILARQRTQIAPFMFLLLAMPVTEHVEEKRDRKERRSGQRAWSDWDARHGDFG